MHKPKRAGRRVAVGGGVARVGYSPLRMAMGDRDGLHAQAGELDLKSGVALVIDQDSGEVLFSKHAHAVLPIASLTKLMTAIVVLESALPLDEPLAIGAVDVDTEKVGRSRLRVGTVLTRAELLHLALMASENRAAHALGRHHPGGLPAFVAAMNRRARTLGMDSTHFVEPTGLSSENRSSADDLVTLVKASLGHPLIRSMSVSPSLEVVAGRRVLRFVNTNRLVSNPDWDIGLQKTGYISEAGRCLVMQARLAERSLILVFLDSAGKYTRFGDAQRVRRWLESGAVGAPSAAPPARPEPWPDDAPEPRPALTMRPTSRTS